MSESWDRKWMGMVAEISTWSKDHSRKTGAIIVDDRNCLVSMGYNGFPRGVDDDVSERHERPAKYLWTEHAERNAIYSAASNGHPVRGCKMYLSWYPCTPCARGIIQSGIAELVCVEPDWDDPKWADDFAIVKPMLHEAGVSVRFIEWAKSPEMR